MSPRGHKKRGAYDCTIWFEDGARYRLQSTRDGHTNAEILESIQKHLVKILEASKNASERRAIQQKEASA